ncbi:MAG TPA: vWA domain-containing protein, partial [Isosphaeraceae bacterium]|nr:vWA domain-containing protein [Isosphaeraceae bacterium]
MFGNFSIGNFSMSVAHPWWLILIPLILPPLIWMSRKSLAGLGQFRRAMAILLRSAVLTLLALALAEVQMVRRSDKLTTLFLVDMSQSIPRDRQQPMMQLVNNAITTQKRKDDLAGVIVFGKNPRVELPPTPYPSDLLGIESAVDTEYTDLGSAIKLALATFPEDTARRIVVLSDGNENRGNSVEQALSAKGLGVQVDVLPIDYFYDREVLVEKISLPSDVKKGESVNINVVVRASEPTRGTLQIYQKTDNYRAPAPGNEQPQPVELQRGPNVFTLRQTINEPNFYTYIAEFVPDKDSGDRRAVNNIAEGFTHARGIGQVLLI